MKIWRTKAISADVSIEDRGSMPLYFIALRKMVVVVTRVTSYNLGIVVMWDVLNVESVYRSPRNTLQG